MARLRDRVSSFACVKICLYVWVGNLVGACLLALVYKLGGGGLTASSDTLLQLIAVKKMSAPAVELFFRAILCNWLVCLALWMSARVDSDAAKCVVIFWCLLAFYRQWF